MPCRDFFSFCTTLKPVELKALGELSHVRHLEKGDLIYKTGDAAEEIYSVNRGVIELVLPVAGEDDERTYLSRGDIFGATETLACTARSHAAHAQESASVQCFARDNFAAISRRVPAFFLFLCEKMAARLQQPDPGKRVSVCKQLSGSLANFDLVTVHQTIISSGQTGELCVLNENGERVATFYFEHGAPKSGHFLHLTGTEAFWQLFLSDEIPGTFSFTSGARPTTERMPAVEITDSPNDLLLEAMQYRDELEELKKRAPSPLTPLQRTTDRLTWRPKTDPELRDVAEEIWTSITGPRVTIRDLFRQNSVCELKIYGVVAELLRDGQLAVAKAGTPLVSSV
ncbi:MAG: cyclic nucleotide-binding domain-containing protein [Verrucomicrobia bacterium]|nr:cyclic nucleotide-binding domain-containing protein [Verrucomicrobiota bacterium]